MYTLLAKKEQQMLLWYTFRQNNSGGYFQEPAHFVLVQAHNPSEAVSLAERHGLYFDGSGDCSCCGDRWSEPWEDGTPTPKVYDMSLVEYEYGKWSFSYANREIPRYLVVFNDGRTLSGSAVENNWTDEKLQ